MPDLYAKLIVNPVAGGGVVGKKWSQISEKLRANGLTFDHEFTESPGHATQISKQAVSDGYRKIFAVGGDGTVNEVVNGIMDSSHYPEIILGILSSGTACNFVRSLDIDHEEVSESSLFKSQKSMLVDIGVVQYWKNGQLRKRFFINEASIGFPAKIADMWASLPKIYGQKINYTLRTITGYGGMAIYRNKSVKLCTIDKVEIMRVSAMVISNGRYFADGMIIAPNAKVDDSLLDVIVFEDTSKINVLKMRSALYDGSHIGLSKVIENKLATLTVDSDEQMLVETDGEIIGQLPASFSLIPAALKIIW